MNITKNNNISITYDVPQTETVYFKLSKNLDTHACYNKKIKTYTIPVSGVYLVRKEFKVGDIVNCPLEIKRETTGE